MLDKWTAYNGIQDLPEGYQYLTVNHKLHLSDPLSSVKRHWAIPTKIQRGALGAVWDLTNFSVQLTGAVYVEEGV